MPFILYCARISLSEKQVSVLQIRTAERITYGRSDQVFRGEAEGDPRGAVKKAFPTVIDASARQYSEIYVSGGRIGTSIRLDPQDLARVVRATFADILARP